MVHSSSILFAATVAVGAISSTFAAPTRGSASIYQRELDDYSLFERSVEARNPPPHHHNKGGHGGPDHKAHNCAKGDKACRKAYWQQHNKGHGGHGNKGHQGKGQKGPTNSAPPAVTPPVDASSSVTPPVTPPTEAGATTDAGAGVTADASAAPVPAPARRAYDEDFMELLSRDVEDIFARHNQGNHAKGSHPELAQTYTDAQGKPCPKGAAGKKCRKEARQRTHQKGTKGQQAPAQVPVLAPAGLSTTPPPPVDASAAGMPPPTDATPAPTRRDYEFDLFSRDYEFEDLLARDEFELEDLIARDEYEELMARDDFYDELD